MISENDSLELIPRPCRGRHELRRLKAGELTGAEADGARGHLDGCATCQQRWAELEAEDREVAEAVPLARLEARLHGVPPEAKVLPLRRAARLAPIVGLALAASLALVLFRAPTADSNRTKGGIALDVFVGGVGEPRHVDAQSIALAPGERLQLKVNGDGRRFVAVVSIDEQGQVSPIYFAGDASLPLGPGLQSLPQSIAFDGRGRERLVVLLSGAPLSREVIERAAQEAFRRGGNLDEMGKLELAGKVDELDRMVLKPEGK